MPLKGTCTSMCPLKEYEFRSNRNLLASFETDEETCVAEFLRPGAGQVMIPDKIRTPEVLKNTTDYLLGPHFLNLEFHGENWLYTSNFITDRLRQVRKEAVQQDIESGLLIYILEKVIRYHLLIAWKLHYENEKDYDPHLNDTLLDTYFNDLMEAYSQSHTNQPDTEHVHYYEFRCYYLLRNLKHTHVLVADLQSTDCLEDVDPPKERIEDSSYRSLHRCCQHLVSYYLLQNYYKVLDMMDKSLTPLLCCVLFNSVNSIRISFLNIINKSFGLKFPLNQLCRWLKFDGLSDLNCMLEMAGVRYDNQFAYFNKDKQLEEIQGLELRRLSQKFSYLTLMLSKFHSNSDLSLMVNGRYGSCDDWGE